MMKRIIRTQVLLLTFLAFSTNAFAYVYMVCGNKKVKWKNDTVTMHAAQVSFPSGSPYTSSLSKAIASWNLNPSKFNFLLAVGGPTGDAIGDGQNEIASVDDASLVGDARAVTFRQIDCDNAEIWEADVLFNLNQPWTSSTLKWHITTYGGDHVSFEGVAEHELGHVLGLQHEDRTLNIMLTWAQFHTNYIFADTYPGEDASDGAVYLYGIDPSRPQDLGVSHFKWIADYGAFQRTAIFDHEPTTEHNWTEMMDLVDGFVSWRDFESEPRFIVFNGQQIWPEFTYENNGADTQTVRLGFYISNDDYITTSDRRIGGSNITLGRDWVYTKTIPVTLPSDLYEEQDYYLGVIIDDNNNVAETLSESNATYIGIRTGKVRPVSLIFNPMYVSSAGSTTGTIILNGAAPSGGIQLEIVDDHPLSVTTPATIIVPSGSKSVSFNVTTSRITRIGNGYVTINVSARRPDTGEDTNGSFYLSTLEGYHPDETICEAEPDFPPCVRCLEHPDLPFCDALLGITQEDEYISLEELMHNGRGREFDDYRGYEFKTH